MNISELSKLIIQLVCYVTVSWRRTIAASLRQGLYCTLETFKKPGNKEHYYQALKRVVFVNQLVLVEVFLLLTLLKIYNTCG